MLSTSHCYHRILRELRAAIPSYYPQWLTQTLGLRDGHSAGEGRDLNWGPSVPIITQPRPSQAPWMWGECLGLWEEGQKGLAALSTYSLLSPVESDSPGPDPAPKQPHGLNVKISLGHFHGTLRD